MLCFPGSDLPAWPLPRHILWVLVPLCVGHCSWGLQRCMFLWSVPDWGLFWSQWPSDIRCLLMYPSVYISGLASNTSLSGKPDALQLEFWDENQEFLLGFWDVLYILWMPKKYYIREAECGASLKERFHQLTEGEYFTGKHKCFLSAVALISLLRGRIKSNMKTSLLLQKFVPHRWELHIQLSCTQLD